MYLSHAYREGFYLAREYAPNHTITSALLPPLVLSSSSSGKSLTSIRIDAFIQRENYRRALLLTSSLEERFFGSSMGKVRSTYIDHLSTYERSKIHVPCPIIYVCRSREKNTTSELFLLRVKAFPWVLCEAYHIEAHGLQYRRYTAARALKGVERLRRRGAARGRRLHRPRHWSG